MGKNKKHRKAPPKQARVVAPVEDLSARARYWPLLAGGAAMALAMAAVAGGILQKTAIDRNIFSGDWLVLQEIFVSTFVHDYPLSGYRIGVAPIYLQTAVWFLLASFLPVEAVWFLCPLVTNALAAAGWIVVCRRLGGGALAQSGILFACAAQWLLFSYGKNELFYLTIVTPAHMDTWAATPWLLWASLGRSRARLCFLFALLAATAAGDMLIAPWFAAPALIATAFLRWRGLIPARQAAILAATMAAAIVVGRVLHTAFGPYAESGNTGRFFSLTPDLLLETTVQFFVFASRLATLFWHLGLIWIAFAVLWVFIGWKIARRSRDATAVFIAVFVFFSIVGGPAAMIATGLVHVPADSSDALWNVFEARYMFPALYLPLFAGWPLLLALAGWESKIKPSLRHWAPAATAAIAVAVAAPKIPTESISFFDSPFAVCLRENANRLHWRGGIGSWTFFRNAIIDPQNPIERGLPVENLSVFGERYQDIPLIVTWDISNRSHFAGEFQVVAVNHYQGARFAFPPENEAEGCRDEKCLGQNPISRFVDEETARAVFGEPAEIVECEGVGLFHYDPPIRLDFSNRAAKDFPAPLPRRR